MALKRSTPPIMVFGEKYISIDDVMAMLNITRGRLNRLKDKGVLIPKKFGLYVYYSENDIKKFINNS